MTRIFCALSLALLLCLPTPAEADGELWKELSAAVGDDDAQARRLQGEKWLAEGEANADPVRKLKGMRVLALHRTMSREFAALRELADKGLLLSRELGDFEAQCEFLAALAITHEANGEVGLALALMHEGLAIARRQQLTRTTALLNFRLGGMYGTLGREADAIDRFRDAYEGFGASADVRSMALSLGALADRIAMQVDASEDELARAINHYDRAASLAPEHPGVRYHALIGIGRIHQRQGDFAKAREAYERGFDEATGIPLPPGTRDHFFGRLARAEGRFAQALSSLDSALDAYTARKDTQQAFLVQLERAAALAALKRWSAAAQALEHARAELPQLDSRAMEVTFHTSAASVHAAMGDWESAFRHSQASHDAEQRRRSVAQRTLADELHVRFDVHLKETENALLRSQQQEAASKRLALTLGLALTLLLLFGVALWLRRRVASARILAAQQQALAEAQAARADAEASANRARGTFLAHMSHELRSPLNAMLGFTRLLLRDQTLAHRHDDLAIVLRSGEHLTTLINQVLDMSRIEAGRHVLHETEFDLPGLLEEISQLFKAVAAQKGLRLDMACDPAVPQHVRADGLKLRQVLINLMGNAVKFTDAGRIELAASSVAAGVHFAVTDTGSGIAPEDVATLGRPFVQAKAGDAGTEGTGLGLAISRGFVALMGGDLQITSAAGAGAGTRVHFTLPLRPVEADRALAPAKASARVARLAPRAQPLRLLAVDDRADGRLLLVRLLTPLGFEVREAADGQQALDTWAHWSPHLILMDLRMPVMDGLEATRRIRASEAPARRTLIIALTASSFDEQKEEILAAGCDDYMRKPFEEDALLQMLARHLHLTWEFEPGELAAQHVPDRRRLRALPRAVRERLGAALGRLDVEAVEAALADVRAIDESAAEELSALARNFEYAQMAELVESEVPAAQGAD